MQLPRHARMWLDLEITITDPVGTPVPDATVQASFDDGATWVDADTTAGGHRWLLDGPDYNPAEPGMPAPPDSVTPTTITGRTRYLVRAINPVEVNVGEGIVSLA